MEVNSFIFLILPLLNNIYQILEDIAGVGKRFAIGENMLVLVEQFHQLSFIILNTRERILHIVVNVEDQDRQILKHCIDCEETQKSKRNKA